MRESYDPPPHSQPTGESFPHRGIDRKAGMSNRRRAKNGRSAPHTTPQRYDTRATTGEGRSWLSGGSPRPPTKAEKLEPRATAIASLGAAVCDDDAAMAEILPADVEKLGNVVLALSRASALLLRWLTDTP